VNTLSPRIFLTCGEKREEICVDGLSAPAFLDAIGDSLGALTEGLPALFLDVDGTILDLAERPDNVITPPGLVTTLLRAEQKLAGALALVSGRPIEELDRLFEPLRLRASGIHGVEMRYNPGDLVSSLGARELPQSFLMDLTRLVAAFPGAFIENKRFSFVVHYRLALEAECPLRAAVMHLVDSKKIAVEVMNAHYAIELKAPGRDKGSAIAAFLSTPTFRGRTPIFVGDDLTDESGFAVVVANGGYAFSVGPRRPGAIATFSQPSAVRGWLAEYVDREDGA
jgi:trehalose 6-phosphate phosphatase